MLKHIKINRTVLIATALSGLLFAIACGSGNKPVPPYAYVLSSDSYTDLSAPSSLSQFKMENGGTLIPLSPPTLPIDVPHAGLAVDPGGQYLFTYAGSWGDDATIQQFVIGADGTLRLNSIPSIPAGGPPRALAFSPNGRFALVAIQGTGSNGTLNSYSLGPTGLLTLTSTVPFPTSDTVGSLMFDPTGTFAYAGYGGEQFGIAEYSVSPNGALNFLTTYATDFSGLLTLSPQGFLYASNDFAGPIGEYSINASNGSLSMVNSFDSPFGYPPTFDPTGRYAYTNGLTYVSAQTVDSATGALSSNGVPVLTGACQCFSSSIALDPSGRFLIQAGVVNPDGNALQSQVAGLKINSDGSLTPDGVVPLGSLLPLAITLVRH